MAQTLTDQVEPGAIGWQTSDGHGGYRYLTFTETIQASQAISLKRIADALDSEGPVHSVRSALNEIAYSKRQY